jgi:hypothetical protein
MPKKEKSTSGITTYKEKFIDEQTKFIELLKMQEGLLKKNIDLLEQHRDQLEEETKEQKIILERLNKACESRNKTVHSIVYRSLKNGASDTKAKVLPLKNLETLLKTNED